MQVCSGAEHPALVHVLHKVAAHQSQAKPTPSKLLSGCMLSAVSSSFIRVCSCQGNDGSPRRQQSINPEVALIGFTVWQACVKHYCYIVLTSCDESTVLSGIVRRTLGVCASSRTPVAFLAQPTEVLLLRTLAPLAPGA